MGGVSAASAGTATVRWTHPDPISVDGFRVHQKVAGGGFDLGTDVSKPTPTGSGVYAATITVPDGVVLELRMSAYNLTTGLSSEFSEAQNEVHLLGAPGRPTVVLP